MDAPHRIPRENGSIEYDDEPVSSSRHGTRPRRTHARTDLQRGAGGGSAFAAEGVERRRYVHRRRAVQRVRRRGGASPGHLGEAARRLSGRDRGGVWGAAGVRGRAGEVGQAGCGDRSGTLGYCGGHPIGNSPLVERTTERSACPSQQRGTALRHLVHQRQRRRGG